MERLRAAGFVALLAGGCVRDRLLGRQPKDYDIATNARPDQVHGLFTKARLVGAKFGVVLVRKHGHDIEVATFRTDGAYSDGRRPDEVSFGDERADALRRDFTINGLFLDPFENRVIDYVDGQQDLMRRIIRTIGAPQDRFGEDHLRMLRAVRLSARLGFPIEGQTRRAITDLAPTLRLISPERVWMELELILTEPSRAQGWQLLLETGLRAHLAPHWPLESAFDELARRRLEALGTGSVQSELALSAVLADFDLEAVEEICRSLRLSNQLTDHVSWLVRSLPTAQRAAQLELADFKSLRANPGWPLLLELLRADLSARNQDQRAYLDAKARGEAISIERAAPPPLVTGDELMGLGMRAGPALGSILRAVYRSQLNEEIHSKAEAIELAQRLAAKSGDTQP